MVTNSFDSSAKINTNPWMTRARTSLAVFALFMLAGCIQAPVPATDVPTQEQPTATEVPPTVALPAEATATETVIPEPTSTPTPSDTATLVPTATPADPLLEIHTNANCRGGPGVPYGIDTTVAKGRLLPIIGQSRAFGTLWWNVMTPSGMVCWIWSGLGNATGDLEGVPVPTVPPTPTARPNPTATPTPLVPPIRFGVTFVNKSGTNICFLFITPNTAVGWGKSVLPSNTFIPVNSSITFLLAGGRYNFRAEDCKDDVVEISVDHPITGTTEWVIGP